ncbi:putative WRKY transcription factor 35 [Iris pallida]|uniref:WRKY transcription factor 35 n=1 Tax=Iris pallida TaxID=29817 RepID=A0AAX6F904_IRIPA|nr:putative WRKY transcription factor 35 [Iris pallida]
MHVCVSLSLSSLVQHPHKVEAEAAMCDFFSQSWAETTAHHGGGDLADIVRASGASGPSSAGPANAGTTDHSWHLLLQNDHQPAAAAADFPPPLAVDSFTGGALRTSPLSPVAEKQIKRRKSQAKKVVCIPAAPAGGASHGRSSSSGEVVPSDLWAWRKYGQKPIKGSPYPRGYYRCSSSKGCSARKQVERSRTDPNMLVITYASEHNHPWPTQRNALAGSTRSLQPWRRTAATNKDEAAAAATTSSSNEPAAMDEYSDDFFAGLAELDSEEMSLMYD